LAVQRGTAVVEAVYPFNQAPRFGDPSAQFFVISDHVALSGSAIVNPSESTDRAGQPDVTFGFTPAGSRAFQRITAAVARRGNLVSGLGQTLNQHFAVALDTGLITVPSIDFKQYPAGIPGDNGADITGGFTVASAVQLAAALRLGALPVALRLVSATSD
jgi:preprotein translocase subunit SecD